MNIMTGRQMAHRYWWTQLIRGIIAILFGLAALLWPGPALLVLVALFGAFALLDGISAVIMATHERGYVRGWWLLLIEGIVGILIGVTTFFWPGITALVLLYLIAFWAIFTGVLEMVAAFAPGHLLANDWMLAIAGALSFLLGILLLLQPPAVGLFAVVWLVALYALFYGILTLVRAFQFRDLAKV